MTSARNFPSHRGNWQPSRVKWMQLAHTDTHTDRQTSLPSTPPFLARLFWFVFQTMPNCRCYWFECATYVFHVNASASSCGIWESLSCLPSAINVFSLASVFLVRFYAHSPTFHVSWSFSLFSPRTSDCISRRKCRALKKKRKKSPSKAKISYYPKFVAKLVLPKLYLFKASAETAIFRLHALRFPGQTKSASL